MPAERTDLVRDGLHRPTPAEAVPWTAPRSPATVLTIVCLASMIFPLSLTGASVALPDIAVSLHASDSATNWVVSGYNLCFAGFLLASGSLADLFGRRRLFRCGVALFALGGLLGAASVNILMLDVARAVAGLGAATALTSGSATLAATFEDGPPRRRAFTFFGTALGIGLAFGPLLAGGLVSLIGWRGVFGALGVIGVVALAVSPLLDESSNPAATHVDRWGTFSFTSSLFLLIFGLIEAPTAGWDSVQTAACLMGSAAMFALFIRVEQVGNEPMFDLSLLRSWHFIGVCVAAMAGAMTLVPIVVYLPTYFSSVDGIGAARAGVILLLLTAPTLVFPLAVAVLPPVPVRVLLIGATAMLGPGAIWLTVITPHAAILRLAGPLILIGAGIGTGMSVLDGAAISSVDHSRAGMAAGMFNTVRIASETAAIAVVGSLLVTLTQSHLDGEVARPAPAAQAANSGTLATLAGPARQAAAHAVTEALHDVLWLLGIWAIVATPIVMLTLRQRRTGAAR